MFARWFVTVLLLVQMGNWVVEAVPVKKPNQGPVDSEKQLSQRIRTAPKSKLRSMKMEGAKKLQANMVRCFESLSNNKDTPESVRTAYKNALPAMRSSKLTPSIAAALPTILQETAPYEGNQAQQMQIVLKTVMPYVGGQAGGVGGTKVPLEGALNALSGNLNGVNVLLGKTVSGAPELLNGVVKSMVGTLGGVTDAANFSVGGVGPLLGGLLGGITSVGGVGGVHVR